MGEIYAREREEPDWLDPVVDLIERGRYVGMAYLDEGQVCVEFLPDEGRPHVFDVPALQQALDTAAAMLGGDAEAPKPADADNEASSIETLAAEFDPFAVHRGPEDEGFYRTDAAARITQRCGDLGLAVVSLEGCTIRALNEEPEPGSVMASGAM